MARMRALFELQLLLVLWGSLISHWFPAADWGFLFTRPETYQKRFLVFFDAFSLRFFTTNVLFLYTLFLLHTHLFHVSSSSSSYFFCLARCGFGPSPSFRWDALWGINNDKPYLTIPELQRLSLHFPARLRASHSILCYFVGAWFLVSCACMLW